MKVALVVTCTKTKRLATCERMAFRDLTPGKADVVASSWLERARQAKRYQLDQCAPSQQLYSGRGWAQTLRAQYKVDGTLFVTSAGFGLLKGHQVVPSYEATFSHGADKVGRALCGYASGQDAHRAWWRAVNAARGSALPMSGMLGDFDRVIVALSAPYFAAVSDDLELLAQKRGPERIFVVATGVERDSLSPILRQCVLPLDVQAEQVINTEGVNGPRFTLNQRAMVWLLEDIVPQVGWEREAMDAEIARRQKRSANSHLQTKKRIGQRWGDAEVKDWIRVQWKSDVNLTYSTMLRRLRSTGRACEQARFKELVQALRCEMAERSFDDRGSSANFAKEI